MSVDRLSVAHQIRMAALDDALAAAAQRFGPIPDERIDAAEAALLHATRAGRPKARRPRR